MYNVEASSSSPETEEKYGAEVLERLRQGEMTDKQALKIGEISVDLHQKLLRSGKENIFTEADKKRWEEEIEKTKRQKPGNLEALKSISDKIDQERNEVQKLTQTYVAKMEENSEAFTKDSKRGLNSIQEYLRDFQKLDYKDKLERFNALQADINDRFATIEAILKIDPDMKQHLKTMRRSEREEKLEELSKLINKDLESHEKHIANYKALPDQFKNISPSEFRKLTLQSKAEKMKEMIKAMEKDFDKMLKKAADNKTKSAEDIKEARDYFFARDTSLLGKYGKIKCWESFGSQLEKDMVLVRKFKEGMDEFPSRSDLKDDPNSEFKKMKEEFQKKFDKGTYQEREALIEELEQTMGTMNNSYNQSYLRKLQGYQEQGIISMKTLREYSVWYMLQPLKDKSQFLHKELPKDMTNREMTLIQFKQAIKLISPEKALQWRARFFNQEIGGSAREQVLNELLKEQQITKEDLRALPANDTTAEDIADPSTFQEKPAETSTSRNLENASNTELQKLIDDAKQAETILKKRKLVTSLNLMAEAANDNALRNDQQAVASKRTYGLDAQQQELQEQMNEQEGSNEEMVLVDDPVKGGKVAQKVTKLDVTKTHEKSHEDIYALEKEATRIQQTTKDKRANLGQSIQFTNEAGEAISAQQGMEQVEREKEKLAEEVVKTAAQRAQNRGKGLSETKKKQLEKFAKKQDLNVKLEADYAKTG